MTASRLGFSEGFRPDLRTVGLPSFVNVLNVFYTAWRWACFELILPPNPSPCSCLFEDLVRVLSISHFPFLALLDGLTCWFFFGRKLHRARRGSLRLTHIPLDTCSIVLTHITISRFPVGVNERVDFSRFGFRYTILGRWQYYYELDPVWCYKIMCKKLCNPRGTAGIVTCGFAWTALVAEPLRGVSE